MRRRRLSDASLFPGALDARWKRAQSDTSMQVRASCACGTSIAYPTRTQYRWRTRPAGPSGCVRWPFECLVWAGAGRRRHCIQRPLRYTQRPLTLPESNVPSWPEAHGDRSLKGHARQSTSVEARRARLGSDHWTHFGVSRRGSNGRSGVWRTSDSPTGGANDVRGADAQGVLPTHKVSSVPSCRASAKCSGADPHSRLTSDKTRPQPGTGG